MKRDDIIAKLIGDEKANYLLNHQAKVSKDLLHLPNKKFIDTIWKDSNRNIPTLRNLQLIADTPWPIRWNGLCLHTAGGPGLSIAPGLHLRPTCPCSTRKRL